MKVETMIYIYIFVCLSLMIFNVCYSIIIKRVNKSIEANTKSYEKEIYAEIERIQKGLTVSNEHKKLLYKKLKHISHLTAFDKSLEEIYQKHKATAEQYIFQIYPVFMYLSSEYEKKNEIKSAYFPYVISKYNLVDTKKSVVIIDNVINLLHTKNVYCRENALKVIYSMGDTEYVIKALKIIDREENFHHSKLISDGLMSFSGNKQNLAKVLWDNFDFFSVKMQVNILNFIRFSGERNDNKILMFLSDEKENKEIRLSAIRYFEKYYCKEAEGQLHKFAKNEDGYDWEYQAIASSALKTYPGKNTEEILMKNLSSHNWYVRYNSAESCDRLELSYSELISIFDGSDRYAREMVKYRFDRKAAQKEVAIH